MVLTDTVGVDGEALAHRGRMKVKDDDGKEFS
jgi:hypothetical protein